MIGMGNFIGAPVFALSALVRPVGEVPTGFFKPGINEGIASFLLCYAIRRQIRSLRLAVNGPLQRLYTPILPGIGEKPGQCKKKMSRFANPKCRKKSNSWNNRKGAREKNSSETGVHTANSRTDRKLQNRPITRRGCSLIYAKNRDNQAKWKEGID